MFAWNLPPALAEISVVSELLLKDTNKGYFIGPFTSPPFFPFWVNTIGIATRKYSGKKKCTTINYGKLTTLRVLLNLNHAEATGILSLVYCQNFRHWIQVLQ